MPLPNGIWYFWLLNQPPTSSEFEKQTIWYNLHLTYHSSTAKFRRITPAYNLSDIDGDMVKVSARFAAERR